MRLIDADVIRANLMKNIGLTNGFDKAFDETPIIEERKKGKWKYGNGNGECPFCGHERPLGWDNFCGFCGADMRGERKEECPADF